MRDFVRVNTARYPSSICVIGLITIFVIAAVASTPLIYDEAPYIKPIALLHKYGFSVQFFKEYPEPAGLLHNIIHWILEPLTGLRPPFIRFVNPLLLICTIILTALTLRAAKFPNSIVLSLTFVAIPFTWVVSGMVLTEMPSIFFLSLSTYLLTLAHQQQAKDKQLAALTLALTAGLSLGIAFLGRAVVLVVLGALPCLLLNGWRKFIWIGAAYSLGALAVAGPVLVLWGGLVPPLSAVPVGISSLSVYHLILSCAYAATVMFIIAPQWFSLPARFSICIFAVMFGINLCFGFLEISIMRTAVSHLPTNIAELAPRLAGSFMIGLAALFVLSSFKNLRERHSDTIWTFFCVSALLLIASPVKVVHQYSSRYTMMASNMMILATAPYQTFNRWTAVRFAAGMLLGVTSLLSYLYG